MPKIFNSVDGIFFIYQKTVSEKQTSCLNRSLALNVFYRLELEKIIEYDFCPHHEYLVAVSLR